MVYAKRKSCWVLSWLMSAALVVLLCNTALAAVTITGPYSPSPWTAWSGTTTVNMATTPNSTCTMLINGGTVFSPGDGTTNSSFNLGNAFNALGSVTVTEGASWNVNKLCVGNFLMNGRGALNITNGTVTTGFGASSDAGDVILGFTNTSKGTVSVDGSNSLLDIGRNLTFYAGTVTTDTKGLLNITNGMLYLGLQGSGTLLIQNGGGVQTHLDGVIGASGNNTGSTVTVDGSGGQSQWVIDGNLRVGLNGSGTLKITNGGYVHACAGTGDPGTWIGAVNNLVTNCVGTVDGSGSQWVSDRRHRHGQRHQCPGVPYH